ncbi:unnamed protein product [Closterium sp. Yama58-4]|nr:unnamed protein product [Closterium sp. Yama58-4]
MAGGGDVSNGSSPINPSRPKDGYAAGPPWIFKGRALYQLNLVKADVARQVVPPELKLVEAFGYTLGGVYYAQYDSSPAGKFDELVIIPGIVWDPPASCAWAAAVMVDSASARDHGIKEVGLPSRFVSFNKKLLPAPQSVAHTAPLNSISSPPSTSPLNDPSASASPSPSSPSSHAPDKAPLQLLSRFINPWRKGRTQGLGGSREGGFLQVTVCDGGKEGRGGGRGGREKEGKGLEEGSVRLGEPMFELHMKVPSLKELAAVSHLPSIKMSLPSFSGRTEAQPALLKYSCDLSCRVSLMPPATTRISPAYRQRQTSPNSSADALRDSVTSSKDQTAGRKSQDVVVEVLSGRPLIAMCFEGMEMRVEAPTRVLLPATTVMRELKARDIVVATSSLQFEVKDSVESPAEAEYKTA